jgi:hypothetical protein
MTNEILKITYAGKPVKVDVAKITEQLVGGGELQLPALDDDAEYPGLSAERLFRDAEQLGILIAPEGIDIECYGDNDSDGGGFILAAYPKEGLRRGVTCGWRDVDNITRRDNDDRTDHELVINAICFFARELNAALGEWI